MRIRITGTLNTVRQECPTTWVPAQGAARGLLVLGKSPTSRGGSRLSSGVRLAWPCERARLTRPLRKRSTSPDPRGRDSTSPDPRPLWEEARSTRDDQSLGKGDFTSQRAVCRHGHGELGSCCPMPPYKPGGGMVRPRRLTISQGPWWCDRSPMPYHRQRRLARILHHHTVTTNTVTGTGDGGPTVSSSKDSGAHHIINRWGTGGTQPPTLPGLSLYLPNVNLSPLDYKREKACPVEGEDGTDSTRTDTHVHTPSTWRLGTLVPYLIRL